MMATRAEKAGCPVSQIRRYLEPGPIILVSSALGDRRNIMTMGWHRMMEFSPSLVACVIANGNDSFELVRNCRERVINLPSTMLTDKVVGIGNTTGAEIDEFERFCLTARPGERVKAPLVARVSRQFRVQTGG